VNWAQRFLLVGYTRRASPYPLLRIVARWVGRQSGSEPRRAVTECEQTVRGNEINCEGNICKEARAIATGCGKEEQRFSGREMRKILRKTVS
jgi:hypothetical protein